MKVATPLANHVSPLTPYLRFRPAYYTMDRRLEKGWAGLFCNDLVWGSLMKFLYSLRAIISDIEEAFS